MEYVEYRGKKYTIKYGGKLYLDNLKIRDITEIKGLENLSNLKELELYNNEISEIKGLENLTDLRGLNLNKNKISEISRLENLKNLRSLYLKENKITEIKGLENLTNLRECELNNNKITEIKGLENLINLEYLNLSSNQISEIKGLDKLSKLERLYIYSNSISEIKGLENLNHLEHIDLSDNPITDLYELHLVKNGEILEILDYCRTKKPTEYEYDFALSFAGENRDIAEKIAKLLDSKGIKVFYDKFKEADLIGKKLSTYFQDTYGSKSRYVIVLISKEYQIKDWTNFELKIAREEAKIRTSEFILPIKLDDTPILGIHDDIGYIDFRKRKLESTVDLLVEKLKLSLVGEKKSTKLNNKHQSSLFKETAMDLLHKVNQSDVNISEVLPKYLDFLLKINNKEEAKWVQTELSGDFQRVAEEDQNQINYRIIHGYMSPYKFNFMFNDLDLLITNPKNLLSPLEAVLPYSLSSIESIRNDPKKIGVVTLSKNTIMSQLKEKESSFEKLYFYFKGSEVISLIGRIRQKVSSFLVKCLD